MTNWTHLWIGAIFDVTKDEGYPVDELTEDERGMFKRLLCILSNTLCTMFQ